MNSTLPVSHQYVDVADGRLHRLEYPGAGRPMVCVHGVTGTGWVWHDVADHLADVASIHALDMRGHGDSLWSPTHDYSTASQVEALAAHVDDLGLDGVDLCGASWGALVALEYAAANPQRVSRLIIVDIEPSFGVSATDVPPRPQSFDTFADVEAWLADNQPDAPASAIAAMANGSFRGAEGGKVVARHDPFLYEQWPFRDGDHWAALSKVACPTLLVHATATFVQADAMERMAELIDNSQLVQLEQSAHVVPLDRPADLSNAIRDFFAANPS